MNREAQEIINSNTERRLTALENDVKDIKKTVTEMRIDQKDLIKTVNRVNDRWDEFDKTQRKNKNELIMKFLGCIIAGIAGYILAALNLSK